MTAKEFIQKWKRSELKERSAAQQHFLDLCELLGHGKPASLDPLGEWFTFEYGVEKRGGENGFADVWKKGFFGWEYKGKHKDLEEAWRQLDEYRADLENPPLLVVCDTDRFEIHTSFTNAKHVVHTVQLEELAQPEKFEYLRAVFFEPDKLRPGRISKVITADAAKAFGELALSLRGRGIEPLRAARFLDRLVFCLFAEDVAILPNEVASKLLEESRGNPELFQKLSHNLFQEMATGGYFGVDRIPHFNGHLFDDAESLALTVEELELLWTGARLDWSAIDPSIFGTLFERGLDPDKRSQLGAHYTSKEDIETLVEPVVMTPLRREWAETKAAVARVLDGAPRTKQMERKAQTEALIFIDRFLRRLESVTVLDPACGSGNFLYVTLRKLKDLEAEVIDFTLDRHLQPPLRVGVGPWQLYGIEINQYAHELAQMTVWIGYLQWLRQHGASTWKEPILQAMSNIECKDAILDLSDPANPKEPEWPRAEFIVGNPPFLGDKLMRGELGDDYAEKLRDLFADRLPGQSDLCCYWFERARQAIEQQRSSRAGLLATQGIRGGANRRVLERIKETGDIFWAESDRNWILNGATVHVSMVGFDAGTEQDRTLGGKPSPGIHASLTDNADIAMAGRLPINEGVSFIGLSMHGPFDYDQLAAAQIMRDGGNPNGRPNSDVVRPMLNALEIARRAPARWLTLFAPASTAGESAFYEAPFEKVRTEVLPIRRANKRATYRDRWWLPGELRPAMLRALEPLQRFLATPRVSKHRVFVWISQPVIPSDATVAFARDDDYFFGVLHSCLHELWARSQGTQLREVESGFRYTPTTCFETFPFPHPAKDVEESIAAAARELDELRQRWLNPPEWTREEVLEFPGSVDGPWKRFVASPDARGIGTARWPRVVALDDDAAKKLAKRTLTNLYNERPAWLQNAHRKLDEAVFAAYGWPADLADEQILERLLALNLERAGAEVRVP